MSAAKLDGTALAKRIKTALKPRIDAVKKARPHPPSLMLIGAKTKDRSAQSYRLAQLKACAEVGLRVREFLADWRDAGSVLRLIEEKSDFDGVLLDLPLPGVDVEELLSGLPPDRDAEGVTAANFGRLFQIKSYDEIARHGLIAPCTASAIAELARASGVSLAGKTAVVLGRSNIVGKPAAHLLTCLDMTVTLCHSKTPELAKIVSQADVVAVAAGKPRFVKPDWIKPGAVVIDAGINEDGAKLCGDVDPKAAERAGFLTPVPGGVGPVTTAMLLTNVVTLAERRLP